MSYTRYDWRGRVWQTPSWHGLRQRGLRYSDFVAMPFSVVFVSLAVFLVPRRLVRAVTKRLVPGKAAHANPDGLLLRFDFQRSLVRSDNSAHLDEPKVSFHCVKCTQDGPKDDVRDKN